MAAWLATEADLFSGASAAESSLKSETMLVVSSGHLPPVSTMVWKSVQLISTGSERGALQGYCGGAKWGIWKEGQVEGWEKG